MLITRSADYALRAAIYLAAVDADHFIPTHEIAQVVGTPRYLLGRLMQTLARRGILEASKGHRGGYRLARRPADISILEIIESVDGPFVAFACKEPERCGIHLDCQLGSVFTRAERALHEIFAAETLESQAQPLRRNTPAPASWFHGHTAAEGSTPTR